MIKVNDISYSYGSKPCLEHISLQLEKGSIYGLLGENGVGKTTLLTLLSGLKKVQKGSIDIDGYDPYGRNPLFLEKLIYLPETVSPVPMKASAFASSDGIFRPDFSMEVFNELMGIFEMDPSQRMDRMSSGQLKKTYIAFALACRPEFLFLDEPTNGLDIPSKAQFRKAMLSYTREDSTIVVSTHQVKDLENIIDPVIILDNRDVLLNASLEKIADKLYFDYGSAPIKDCLYQEQMPGGLLQVCLNSKGQPSKVSIEALFNTAHKNKEFIKGIFSHE